MDQAIGSTSNVLTLLIAAHLLSGLSFAFYALFQLVATTMVGLQRQIVLAPTLAAQRKAGRAPVPLRWLPGSSLTFTASALAIVGFAHAPASGSQVAWLAIAGPTTLCCLVQDYLRYRSINAGSVIHALLSDSVWLSVTVAALGALWLTHLYSFDATVAAWGSGALSGCAVGLWSLHATRHHTHRLPATLRFADVWLLGRWAALDSILAACVTLLPMFVTAAVAKNSIAGVYQVAVLASGPLNILNTTFVLRYAMHSWQLATAQDVRRFAARVRGAYRFVAPAAAIAIIGAPIAVAAAGFPLTRENLLACTAVALSVAMGAWISPRLAAVRALGYQRYGAFVRIASVIVGIIITISALIHVAGLTDAVGPTMLGSALVAFIGWTLSYRRVLQLES